MYTIVSNMNYNLVKDTVDLINEFELSNTQEQYSNDLEGFKRWVADNAENTTSFGTVNWEGKESGRTIESFINTLIVHMNRYAKNYSKSAIYDSEFTTQEEFIFLIVLRSFGAMSKMDLIKRNIIEKPAGMKLIDRLLKHGWVNQIDCTIDKRSKLISITQKGIDTLDKQMDKIRKATSIVTANLTESEKLQLVRILSKLNDFHHEIYTRNIFPADLLDTVFEENYLEVV